MLHIDKTFQHNMPFVVQDVRSHTMSESLIRYLEMKVHPLIKENNYKSIIVLGRHSRQTLISNIEKHDKKFNFMRPSVSVDRFTKTLYLYVYPGTDYVKHYASIIATYLALHNKDFRCAKYIIPTEQEAYAPLLESNLSILNPSKSVIMGYVDLFENYTHGDWLGKDGDFGWKNIEVLGKQITLVGCRHSYWGDIAGRIVKILATLGVEKIVYIGKLGSLDPKCIPNQSIATGSTSFLNGEYITWKNIFESAQHKLLFHGNHYCLPSVLYETKKWLQSVNGFNFIDPEIGHMARAANESYIQFGYLHIVSDSLVNKHDYDLSNERKEDVIRNRRKLLKIIEKLLITYL